jgi:glucose/arabinose dehydrogenase/mono/diheme cytochrome c family protein
MGVISSEPRAGLKSKLIAQCFAVVVNRFDVENGNQFTADMQKISRPTITLAGKSFYAGLPLRLVALFVCAISRIFAQERFTHAELIKSWNANSFARGKALYESICITCHGTPEKEGTLPTSRAFWKEPFKNGTDPLSIYKTLTNGLGQMPAWPSLTPANRYDVIHYLREAFLKPQNPSAYFKVTDAYLRSLPREPIPNTSDVAAAENIAPYLRMNFGTSLNWTYEVAPGNIAYKGIAVRLDNGPGGISKGRAWMLYDHDTMRVAAAWSGTNFIDWKGIAFDGSHGTHASIVGEKAFVLPPGPGWAHPETGSFADNRLRGLDGKPYGPLARNWAHFKGAYHNGNSIVLNYTVGTTEILETPGLLTNANSIAFTRVLSIGRSEHDLALRLAPHGTRVKVQSNTGVRLVETDACAILQIRAEQTPLRIGIALAATGVTADDFQLLTEKFSATDLSPLISGGAPKWNLEMQTEIARGLQDGPYAVDTLTLPADKVNPWNSWMRLGGFDFFEDGDSAAVCTWLGEVWLVRGLTGDHLRWKRIAAGLFQPLGLKIIAGKIYVSCRDQIARLHDLNGDEEIDFYENFNNDHQVTEHFHEFAMGLQTDRDGNFYYAKSARHALPPLVPHHGTLLRVTKDGSRTEIVASGFRAANGVCVNDDGTFFVTDQEGHWTPKNRINHIVPDRFYGNMWSYHHPESTADSAMEPPLVWITNEMDRSPGELVRITSDRWGALNGGLLNLSYGTGRIFFVPHEFVEGRAQGGVVQLPIPDLPTGVMRGRIHPKTGALYACGMTAWASNKSQDGGFYRVTPAGKPVHLPIRLHARSNGMDVTFSDGIEHGAAENPTNYAVKIWSLLRSENYGSRHINERPLKVTGATLSEDARTIRLELEDFQPTWCMEIKCKLRAENGETFERVIHNTVHKVVTESSP